MITVKFKNKYIYYCIEGCFNSLDPRFVTHLWQLAETNDDDEYEQTVSIPKEELVRLYSSVSQNTEGVSAAINKELNDILLPQIMQQFEITLEKLNEIQNFVFSGKQIPFYLDEKELSEDDKATLEFIKYLNENEGAYVLWKIIENNFANNKYKLSKINGGKAMLLKPYK